MGRTSTARGTGAQRGNPFVVDEDAARAKLERTWADAGFHAFSAAGGTWCAVSSADEVLTGDTPGELNQKVRAHWLAMQ